jgi:BCD family chlorophyll transporter-like MFS transporter
MLAYSMQDLILEPFAGLVFGMTPGQTTRLSGLQNGGVFAGMVLVGVLGSVLARRIPSILKLFTVGGCLLSALALVGLCAAPAFAATWPVAVNVWALGFSNGIFAVAAIGSMMALAGAAGDARTGLRMGLWGAAQAIAFGLGGFVGTVAVEVLRAGGSSVAHAYGGVFLCEALVFVAAALIAARIGRPVAAARNGRFAAVQAAE